MPEWKFVLDEQAFDFFRRMVASDRATLLRAFEELARPTHQGSKQSKDDHGRIVQVEGFGKFLVHYWDDFAAKELRIVRLARRA